MTTQYIYDLTDTWNAGGTVFNAIKMNVTNSASAAGSKLLDLQIGGTTLFNVDKTGNVGIGVNPVVPSNLILNLQVGSKFSLNFGGTTGSVSYNSYYDGAFKYITNDFAVDYRQNSNVGSHAWFIAPSGTAGSVVSYTAAMTLNASGNLGVGTVNPGGNASNRELTVAGSGSAQSAFITNSTVFNTVGSNATVGYLGTTSNHPLLFTTNNSEKMRIDTSGNVAIGATSTVRTLRLARPSGFAAELSLTGTGNSESLEFYIAQDSASNAYVWNRSNNILAFGTNNTERMRIVASGDVGIGNISPAFRLDVVNNVAGLARFSFSNPNAGMTQTDVRIGAGSNTNDIFVGIDSTGSFIDDRSTSGVFRIQRSGTERMRIDASGNVGIGTSSPSSRLQVVSAGTGMASFVGPEYAQIRHSDGTRTLFTSVYNNAAQIGTESNTPLLFVTNNTERMRIDAAGNVGVALAPSAWLSSYRALNVQTGSMASAASSSELYVSANSFLDTGPTWKYVANSHASQYRQAASVHSWHIAASGTAGNAISFTQAMTLDASGNLGIGTTSPGVRLDVSSSASTPVVLRREANANGLELGIQFNLQQSGGTSVAYGGVYGYINSNTAGSQNGGLIFKYTANNSTLTEGMRIDNAGNVGIGMAAVASQGVLQIKVASGYALKFHQASTYAYIAANNEAGSANVDLNIIAKDLTFAGNGSTIVGTGAIGTTATTGFLYVPGCAGTPTGTPTTFAGRVPIVVDTTNNKLYFYSGGAWRDAGP